MLFIVFEILLWYVQTGSWKEAFERVIPSRKIDKESANESTTASIQSSEEEEANEQGGTGKHDGTNLQELKEHRTSEQAYTSSDEKPLSKP